MFDLTDKKTSDESITDGLGNVYGHLTDKVQKVTGALYRVTDLLSDKEPIKWTLRDKAVTLHNNLMSIRFIKDKDNVLNEIMNSFFQIIKSLELVSLGFSISNINFEILRREYVDLRNFFEGKKSNIITEQKLLSGFSAKKEGRRRKPEETGVIVAGNGQDRKTRILDFMETGGEKTMGEIAAIFSGEISEKAVQRDLFDLVKSGKLTARGDKRWRKYEFISPPIPLNAPRGTDKLIDLTEDNI